jgi:S-adenosyl methyltransferase
MPTPPPGIDASRPSIARVYDYLLGGKDNFAADRELAGQILALNPGTRDWARANREFLCAAAARAAREGGISQFLDLGAGLPASPAVHDAARAVIPDARFAYVDFDPSAVLHAQVLLRKTEGLVSILADLTDSETVLSHPDTARVLDLNRPVGIIIGGVAHFLSAPRMREVAARYLSRVQPGSWLIISAGRAENEEVNTKLQPVYTAAETFRHSHEDFASFFDGTDIVPPGLVEARRWIAGVNTAPPSLGLYMLCGAGIKR